MKKVLISVYSCCPNRGSEPGNGWNWTTGYSKANYSVYCITSMRYKKRIEEFCKLNGVGSIEFFFPDKWVPGHLLKLPFLGEYLHYYAWLFSARKKCLKLTKFLHFNHAHHATFSSIRLGTPLYNLGIKTVIGPLGGADTLHQSLKKYLGRERYFLPVKTLFGQFLAAINPAVRKSVRSADLILVSNSVAAQTIEKFKPKVVREMFDAGLPGYFIKPFEEKKIRDTLNILWIGRILPRKGLNLALEAVAKLPKDLNFHFFVVGEGKAIQQRKFQAEQLQLNQKVSFLGSIPHHRLSAVLSEAHIFLFPSLLDSCPMQVFEALASGLPVVTLNHQGMENQVSDETGVKINIGESVCYPTELANGILSLVRDEEKYIRFSRNAHAFGQQQIWETRIKTFIETL